MNIQHIIDTIEQCFGGAAAVLAMPLVGILLLAGLIFTVGLGFIQREFFHAWSIPFSRRHKSRPGEQSHFKALSMALSGTVGLGNIAGVAVAIKMGGPGALLWMVLVGVLGMATKFAECTLAARYQQAVPGGAIGGPTIYMPAVLGPHGKWLAGFYATAAFFAAIGAACLFQVNQSAVILEQSFEVPRLVTGIVLMIATGVVILGGVRRIGSVASKIVPLMAVLYVGACLAVIVKRFDVVPGALQLILRDAFTGEFARSAPESSAFFGGAFGFMVAQGVRRALLSCEAGLGSAAMAHASARSREPVVIGLVALLEPFIDTVVICSMTALTIVVTGAHHIDGNGIELTQWAMSSQFPVYGKWILPIAVIMFCYSTMISWSYYGEVTSVYLLGPRGRHFHRWVFVLCIPAGALWALGPILNFADLAMTLMFFANISVVLFRVGELRELTRDYFRRRRNGPIEDASQIQ